jgi:hypothetical protein
MRPPRPTIDRRVVAAGSGGLAVVALVLAVGACGSRHDGGQGGAAAPASIAVGYASLAQLRRDAASVALIRPTGAASVEWVHGVPFTVATVRVLETLSGTRPPDRIGLRQLGRAGDSVGGRLVSGDHVYLAFVRPFRWRRGGPPVGREYVVLGGEQGLYERPGGSAPADPTRRAFTRVDAAWPALPARISVADARHG